jgi:hypothetical protein
VVLVDVLAMVVLVVLVLVVDEVVVVSSSTDVVEVVDVDEVDDDEVPLEPTVEGPELTVEDELRETWMPASSASTASNVTPSTTMVICRPRLVFGGAATGLLFRRLVPAQDVWVRRWLPQGSGRIHHIV